LQRILISFYFTKKRKKHLKTLKMKKIIILLVVTIFFSNILISCNRAGKNHEPNSDSIFQDTVKNIIVASEQMEEYIDLIKNKRIALVVNQTAMVRNNHLVDTLLSLGIDIKKVFAPEHGFRGDVAPGDHINNEIDEKTGLPIVSIFGQKLKPTPEDLADVDIVIFDIQDVGVRFFTFISTMHNVMEACAENNKKMIIFDRPNPNGDQVDGPVLKSGFESFVGKHKIPVVHGLTIGELAQMINGEHWLKDSLQCDLTIITCKNYDHSMLYSLPVKPSPNLPNDISVRLYPSLCFFEATNFSIGRGTQIPFQIIGYPDEKFGTFTFTPVDIEGMQTNPLQEGKLCYGIDLRSENITSKFTLKYVIDFYNTSQMGKNFFSRSDWFNMLAGNSELQQQIIDGKNEQEIRATWNDELNLYKVLRKKYLLYKDFE
jgi:uncharacterized protein YbbC (DUF1343 family)